MMKRGSERSGNFLKVTQLLSGGSGVWTHVMVAAEPIGLTTVLYYPLFLQVEDIHKD